MGNLGAAAVGGLFTLVVGLLAVFGKARLDRRTDTDRARRAFYVELLTFLVGRVQFMNVAAWDNDAKEPDVSPERVDALNALLLIDATDAVATKAKVCFELLSRSRASQALGAPIEVNEHGLYVYNFAAHPNPTTEARSLILRDALGRIADDYRTALDALAEQIKSEIHR